MQHGLINNFANILKFERSSGACGQVAAQLCQFKGSQGSDSWFQQSVELTHIGGRFLWIVKEPSTIWDSSMEKSFLSHSKQWKIMKSLPGDKAWDAGMRCISSRGTDIGFPVYCIHIYYMMLELCSPGDKVHLYHFRTALQEEMWMFLIYKHVDWSFRKEIISRSKQVID